VAPVRPGGTQPSQMTAPKRVIASVTPQDDDSG
jgi:hypothetical protein